MTCNSNLAPYFSCEIGLLNETTAGAFGEVQYKQNLSYPTDQLFSVNFIQDYFDYRTVSC